MTRINEPRADPRRDFALLFVLYRANEWFQIANISLFEKRFERWLVRTNAIPILAFQIRLLQHHRIAQDHGRDVYRGLRRKDWTFVTISRQQRQASNVIEMPVREQNG